MAKIFVLCTLAVLVVIASSKSLGHQEETCYDCTDAVEAGEVHKRQKRNRNAPETINAVTGLVGTILGTTWNGIARVHRIKARANQTRVINIGEGNDNNNRVIINDGDFWRRRRRPSFGYGNYNRGKNINSLRPNFNYRNQGNNYLRDSYDDYGNGESINSLPSSFNYRNQGNNYLRDSYDDYGNGENINSLPPSFNIGNQGNDYYYDY